MRTPVNEDKDEMLASVVLRGSECTKVNFIFDKTSTYSNALMRGLSKKVELGWFERKSRNLAGKRLSMQFAILEEIFPK